jgi:uncharacterized membrane protein
MILLSITGLFRTIIIVLGVIFLLRLVGKMAQARRNISDEKRMHQENTEAKKMVEVAKENYGKTSIDTKPKEDKSNPAYSDFEEVD